MGNERCVVVPWVRTEQKEQFMRAWHIEKIPDWLVFQQDKEKEGCAVTKNKGVQEAVVRGAEIVIILDDDCFPRAVDMTLDRFASLHAKALEPQRVPLYRAVTDPPSRGTPYYETTIKMPVAASMGFWSVNPDFCAPRQLVHDQFLMTFKPQIVYKEYFSLCGMNLAFRPYEWTPWCTFIDVPRFDDIWMGWLWQKEAYRRGACFNLHGPPINHHRQSDVWANIQIESKYLKKNETLWKEIASCPEESYEELVKLTR